MKNLKKDCQEQCKKLEYVIFAKNLKIITLNNQIISFNPHKRVAEISILMNECKLWTRRHEDVKDNTHISKKNVLSKTRLALHEKLTLSTSFN